MLLVFTTYLLVIWVLCETHFYYRGGNEHFLVGNSSLQSQKWPTEEDVLQPWQFIQLEITTQTFLNSRFGWLGRPLTVTNTTNRICHLQIHDPWRFCLCQSNKKWNFLEKYIWFVEAHHQVAKYWGLVLTISIWLRLNDLSPGSYTLMLLVLRVWIGLFPRKCWSFHYCMTYGHKTCIIV